MAKMWEQQSDLDREQKVADYICSKWKCSEFKLSISYYADRLLVVDGKIVSVLEIRTRKKKYDTIMLSVQKRMHVNQVAEEMGVPAVFAVRYDDGVYWIDLKEEPDRTEIGGRNNMRDARDVEPVHHYNISRLKRI